MTRRSAFATATVLLVVMVMGLRGERLAAQPAAEQARRVAFTDTPGVGP